MANTVQSRLNQTARAVQFGAEPDLFNRPLPSSKNPHFQNEARCTTFLVKMSYICMKMKNDFHIKGWAPTLVLKQSPGGTRKWPIYRSSTGVPELRVLIALLKHLFMYVFNLSVLVQVEAGPCPNVRNIKWKVGKCDECYCRYTVVFCPLSCVPT